MTPRRQVGRPGASEKGEFRGDLVGQPVGELRRRGRGVASISLRQPSTDSALSRVQGESCRRPGAVAPAPRRAARNARRAAGARE